MSFFMFNPYTRTFHLPSAGASVIGGGVSPPFFEPAGTQVSVAPVDKMNIFQTVQWIRTFAESKKWENADEYAQRFWEQKISGLKLQELTTEIMEVLLGIKNEEHRREIMSTIRSLYPGLPVGRDFISSEEQSSISVADSGQSHCKRSNCLYEQIPMESISPSILNCPQLINDDDHEVSDIESCRLSCVTEHTKGDTSSECGLSINSSRTKLMDDYNSVYGSFSMLKMTRARKSEVYEDSNKDYSQVYPASSHQGSSERFDDLAEIELPETKRLFVTIETDKHGDPVTLIMCRFKELNIDFEGIRRAERGSNTLVISFSSSRKAQEVHSQSQEIGYAFRWKWCNRPGPQDRKMYQVLRDVWIYSGKSSKAKKIRLLKKGCIVTVNQLKRRRVRVIDANENGKTVVVGWVDLYTKCGLKCLYPLDE